MVSEMTFKSRVARVEDERTKLAGILMSVLYIELPYATKAAQADQIMIGPRISDLRRQLKGQLKFDGWYLSVWNHFPSKSEGQEAILKKASALYLVSAWPPD